MVEAISSIISSFSNLIHFLHILMVGNFVRTVALILILFYAWIKDANSVRQIIRKEMNHIKCARQYSNFKTKRNLFFFKNWGKDMKALILEAKKIDFFRQSSIKIF